MNNEEFIRLQATVPDFVKNYCQYIDPDLLEYDHNRSQIRAHGHRVDLYAYFAELIKKGVKLPPISVIPLASGKYKEMEGNTRSGGGKLAGKPVLISTYHHSALNYGPDEWADFQAMCNDHLLSSPNTVEDIENFISKQVKSGRLDRILKCTYVGNEAKYIKDGAAHYKTKIYKNSGHGQRFFESRVKKALRGTTKTFFENYSKKEAFDFVKTQKNFPGKRNGDVCGNAVYWTFDRLKHLNPNVIGAITSIQANNAPHKIDVSLVYHIGDLVGRNARDILKARKEIEKLVNRLNKYQMAITKTGQKMFDHLYFLPQIKQDTQYKDENNNTIKIKKEDLLKIIKSTAI